MFSSRYSARMIVTSLAVTSAMAAHASLAVAEDLDANTQLADVIAGEQENLTNENQNMNQQDASGNGVMSEQQERIIALLDETIKITDEAITIAHAKDLGNEGYTAAKIKQQAADLQEVAATTRDKDVLKALEFRARVLKEAAVDVNRKASNVGASEADVAKVRQEVSQAIDAFLREIDETLAIAETKEQTDSLKNYVHLARVSKANVELMKQKLPTLGLEELQELKDNIDITSVGFRNNLGIAIKDAPDKSRQSSSADSGARGIIGVILGVLGVGAIVAAIMQFGGPALKNLGVNLPGIPQQ
ncbi:hypothetical protein [uncultured Corynebacterium sp.]|uniref:hypothetical protein n=1 Tax=uncultured Corynebacterium sp. TaxID=159447 RepID=UPI0028E59C90|nr:hypothetical protein [uncultured Corynebacterium sp.]